jgi:hypothetical protein
MAIVSGAHDEIRVSFSLARIPEIKVDAHVQEMEPRPVDAPVAMQNVELRFGHRPDGACGLERPSDNPPPAAPDPEVGFGYPDHAHGDSRFSGQPTAKGSRDTRALVPAESRFTCSSLPASRGLHQLEPSTGPPANAVQETQGCWRGRPHCKLEAMMGKTVEPVGESIRNEARSVSLLPALRVERMDVLDVNAQSRLLEVSEVA